MIDTSTLFDILSSEIRRRLLFLLLDADSVNVPEGIQTRGAAAPQPSNVQLPQEFSSRRSALELLEIQLCHNHLPKLEDERLIEWDRDAELVSKGPAFEEIEPTLCMLAANAYELPSALF